MKTKCFKFPVNRSAVVPSLLFLGWAVTIWDIFSGRTSINTWRNPIIGSLIGILIGSQILGVILARSSKYRNLGLVFITAAAVHGMLLPFSIVFWVTLWPKY